MHPDKATGGPAETETQVSILHGLTSILAGLDPQPGGDSAARRLHPSAPVAPPVDGQAGFLHHVWHVACTLRPRSKPTDPLREGSAMRGLIRTLLAGWGAKKLGGGCFSTIIIFIILFWLLGYVL
jgi:hypothetical protein